MYSKHRQGGSSILEALVGILIFSIGVIALMGLQAASIRNVSESRFRADASFLANQLVGQMWTDVPNLASYAGSFNPSDASGASPRSKWDFVVSKSLPAATTTVAVNGSVATITIKWTVPGQDQHEYKTTANVTL